MHSSLRVPEIRHAICAELDSRDGLSKLSRVSRDWCDVANIYLWENLDSILPLICLLPSDSWETAASSSPLRRVFSLTRPLTPLDWAPVLRRSSLVKALREPTSGTYPKIEAEALRAICRYPPPFTLLPRLRDLCFHTHDDQQYARANFYIQHISPALRTLQIHGTWPTDVSVMSVAESCPSLDTFDCDCTSLEASTTGMIFDLAQAVLKWRALTDVSLCLGPQALNTVLCAVARLPVLRSMTVRCYEHPQRCPILSQNSFPSLQHLVFRGCWLSVVDAILASWTVRPVETISITISFGTLVSLEQLTHTLRGIQEHCEPNSLLELLLHFELQYLDIWRLRLEHIAPLSHFSNLMHVVVCGPGNFDIDEDACVQFARWWPRLERLTIGPNIERRAARRLCPLGALHTFAIRCPNLKTLALPLTAHEVPDIDSSLARSSARQSSLTYLKVGDAPIENPAAVAHFLAALFPNLERAEYEELVDDEEEEEVNLVNHQQETKQRMQAWDLVKKTLTSLQNKEK
ncbi:hypothetical protein BD626DRAFT_177372 [Schizophyllum amplum]|uniref:F-box domain-containing protein n=1 Tax=Schizophyllum amplum TaxID=97359 RepID=A0A550C274_9AGAR|nr:hypothetical protein BD626DRAFT_177372 [Auriculariopsis ampla]